MSDSTLPGWAEWSLKRMGLSDKSVCLSAIKGGLIDGHYQVLREDERLYVVACKWCGIDLETLVISVRSGGFVCMDDTGWPQTQKAIGIIEETCGLVSDTGKARTYRKK